MDPLTSQLVSTFLPVLGKAIDAAMSNPDTSRQLMADLIGYHTADAVCRDILDAVAHGQLSRATALQCIALIQRDELAKTSRCKSITPN